MGVGAKNKRFWWHDVWSGLTVSRLLVSQVRKWQSLIEAHVDVKTTDGYVLRMFCIAFTKKRQNQMILF